MHDRQFAVAASRISKKKRRIDNRVGNEVPQVRNAWPRLTLAKAG